MSADIKLLKTHIFKILQSGGYFGRLLGWLLKNRLPLMKNVLQQLAKSVFIPLGLIATVSAALTITLRTAALIISNEEMEDIIKTVKSLKNFAYY